MTQKSVAKTSPTPSAKLVVFGLDSQWRPHAAWFPHSQAEAARTAAKQLRLNVTEVTNGTAADIVAKLPTGQIHATGPSMVPAVHPEVYEKLVATLNPRGEAGKEPGDPTLADLPESWSAIKPGHLILAQDSLVDGWYEAIVVSRAGDKITYRWRDYPGHPKVTVKATAVALVCPTAS